jgi:uncharacterized membrane protein YcaP (DUF421 family)
MVPLLKVDWHGIFVPSTPILETLVRGTITYLFIFVLFRILVKRESGALGITDLIVVVLIADAAQNAMADNYSSVTDGLFLIGTIVAWDWLLSYVAFHSKTVARLIRPGKLLLIQDGRLERKNMRKELITEEELRAKLRLQGYEDPSEVKRAYMEPDGRISILAGDKKPHEEPEKEMI